MQILTLQQGTPEWHAHRSQHWNASDAPAMMGASKYKTRTQLLHELCSGLVPEVDPETQRRFDAGHRFEALARPLAEKLIGEDLYPCVGTEGRYSASFDGLTMDESVAFEHKTLNTTLAECIRASDDGRQLPLEYRLQMEHQLLVSGADRALFMASRWDAEGTLVEEHHCWYEPDAELRAALIGGWRQFENDLADFVPVHYPPKPAGVRPETLPALLIEISGQVQATNLPAFKAHALQMFEGINTVLATDQDFADAESAVKWCGEVESRLKAAKEHALGQTATIAEVFATIDDIIELSKSKRLNLDKLIKSRKDEIRSDMVTTAMADLRQHVAELNATLPRTIVLMPAADFAGAIKGKRNLDSMQDAVDAALAGAKATATATALLASTNLAAFAACGANHQAALFPDLAQLALKPAEDFRVLVSGRIAQHEAEQRAAEERRAEQERQRQEAFLASQQRQAANTPMVQRGLPPIEPVALAAKAEAPDGGAMCKLSQIAEQLGIPVTADLLGLLGFQFKQRGAAKLYHCADFPEICDALISHIQGRRARVPLAA